MSRDICQDLGIFLHLIMPEMVGSLLHCYVIMLLRIVMLSCCYSQTEIFHYSTSYAVFLQLLLYR